MKNRFIILTVLLAILTVFSFWPSVIGAHYSGAISCPIISAFDMADCSSMSAHMANIISHIADFMIMIASVLPLVVAAAFILQAIRNRDFFKNFISILKNKAAYIDFQRVFISEIKTKTSVFLALKKGILNTKVF